MSQKPPPLPPPSGMPHEELPIGPSLVPLWRWLRAHVRRKPPTPPAAQPPRPTSAA